MKKSILLSLMVIGAVAAMITAATSAVFTDQAQSTGNTFSAGTLDIDLSDDSEGPAEAVTASITFSNMAPGDKVTKPITVSNTGSLALRYAFASGAVDGSPAGLGAAVTLKIVVVASTGACTGSTSFSSPIASGSLSSTTFGDSTQGQQSGDRSLAVSASEVLCLQAELPLSSGNPLQGASTTATFTFSAEQTVNNP